MRERVGEAGEKKRGREKERGGRQIQREGKRKRDRQSEREGVGE